MNKRFEELMVEAGTHALRTCTDGDYEDALRRKVGELVVRECAEVCRNWTSVEDIFTPNHMADLILNHFGIE